MTTEQNYTAQAATDAHDMAAEFVDTMAEMWHSYREISTDLLNDYPNGDSYHHENHVDREYSLTEAAEILDDLRDYEETDTGLWEGLAPRRAISAQAAYTYGNAVYRLWRELVEEIQEELDEMGENIRGNPPLCWFAEILTGSKWERLEMSDEFQSIEDARDEIHENATIRIAEGLPQDYDEEEAISEAGRKYLDLRFALHGLEDQQYEGVVKAARRGAEHGDFTPALALADAIQNGDGGEPNDYKARNIRSACE